MRGSGVYVAERLIDVPGQTLQLRGREPAAGAVAGLAGLLLAAGAYEVALLRVADLRRLSGCRGPFRRQWCAPPIWLGHRTTA